LHDVVAPKRHHPDFLLVLRAFAGLVVVAGHVFVIVPHDRLETLLTIGPLDLSFVFTASPQTGVFVFFVLSGYLMGKGFATRRYSLDGNGAAAFYLARLLRIYPLLLCYIVVFLTIGSLAAPTWQQTYGIIDQILFLQWHRATVVAPFPWFGHLWSIVTECRFYLLVPFFACAIDRWVHSRTFAVRFLAAVVVVGALARCAAWHSIGFGTLPWVNVLDGWQDFVSEPLYVNLDFFLAGMLLNAIPQTSRDPLGARRIVGFVGSIAALYLVTALWGHFAVYQMPSPLLTDTWAYVLPSVVLVWTAVLIRWAERLNASTLHAGRRMPFETAVRFAAFLGTLTYGIYLWHIPFVFYAHPLPFVRVADPLGNYLLSTAQTTLLAVLFAYVTYRGIELPAERLKRRLVRVPPASVTA